MTAFRGIFDGIGEQVQKYFLDIQAVCQDDTVSCQSLVDSKGNFLF